MRFRISHHSGHVVPDDALELLSQHLGPSREQVSFSKVGPFIMATVRDDSPVSMTHDERVDAGRRQVLEVVSDVCEVSPELKFDWFAVSSER
jgi:hypothetical protein